jgi:hypothetical protein
MIPSLNPDEREMLRLISSHPVVPVPLFKPVTDGLQAKRLVALDKHGVWRTTQLGESLIAQTRGSPS